MLRRWETRGHPQYRNGCVPNPAVDEGSPSQRRGQPTRPLMNGEAGANPAAGGAARSHFDDQALQKRHWNCLTQVACTMRPNSE